MAFFFHKDRITYFRHQQANATQHVIPFIEKTMPVQDGVRVMEIGCGEGGVLKAFSEKGCTGTGVELHEPKAALARQFLEEEIRSGKVEILNKNIFDLEFGRGYSKAFDLIVLKDVIEHIYDQPTLITRLKEFLKPGGYVFFGFPPWQMPFGGHQQACSNKILSKLPWIHLLPNFLYRGIMRLFGESGDTINEMMENKKTSITIERFEKIVKQTGYTIADEQHYLVNPIYQWKFGLKPRLQCSWINRIPYIRNFLTTCSYYLIKA